MAGLPIQLRLLVAVAAALFTHFLLIQLRRLSTRALERRSEYRYRKLRSVVTLVTSGVVFCLYFFALGFILSELGVSLTAYLASASVIGLAIGFGLQGAVQDVVTGITFIFSDLVDVGDLVEISGQTGIVKGITLRFVELKNALGASVFIPNRTITNIINYERGYVRCIVDVSLPGEDQARDAAEAAAVRLMQAFHEQFPGILITEPSNEGRFRFSSGKEIVRIKFRIWPNRGQPIESVYVEELIAELKRIDEQYEPWMLAVSYEAERKLRAQPERIGWPWEWR